MVRILNKVDLPSPFGPIKPTLSPSFILNVISLKSKTKCRMNIYESFVKPAYAALIMIISVMITYTFIMGKIQSNSISCLLSVFMGIIIYIIAILVLKVFEIDEIKSRLVRK